MRRARVFVKDQPAGILEEVKRGEHYRVIYDSDYNGPPISLTMPTESKTHEFDRFPPFFEGVLPEGIMLESLLRQKKIDRDDYFEQLLTVGQDLVGAVTVKELDPDSHD